MILDLAEGAVNFVIYAFGACLTMVSILMGMLIHYIIKDRPTEA
jgi:hypothetical protein